MKPKKILNDLQRLLEIQDFKSKEELNEFLKKYQSEGIPEFPEEILNASERAEDMVYEAYQSSKTKGIKLAKEALQIDKECIIAYQYLGERQNNLEQAKTLYEKGIAVGKKKFGGEYEKENKGHFWMIHETRPYMSCMFNLSECYYHSSNIEEAIKILEYLLELNPNDNQGARYILSSHLLEAKKYLKFEQLSKAYADDGGIFFRFNIALYEFIKSGISVQANKYMTEAIEYNPFVVPQLNRKTIMRSNSYAMGSKEEANYYCEYNAKLWKNINGSIQWAKLMNK